MVFGTPNNGRELNNNSIFVIDRVEMTASTRSPTLYASTKIPPPHPGSLFLLLLVPVVIVVDDWKQDLCNHIEQTKANTVETNLKRFCRR
mmetsp:Transcript_10338/g.24836  ORF Transcript_10338/g.24836 Transcript_10338/m.24836 type:complete len:90 (+) Transcript_10338:207-476(+)